MLILNGKPNCAMRLQKSEYWVGKNSRWEYYRHAGDWGICFKEVDGKLITSDDRYTEDIPHLNGQELIPITEAEWRNDNKGYI